MQIYIVNWSSISSEDQIFATKEFCNSFREGKIENHFNECELINCYHMPQDGTGVIICKTKDLKSLYKILKPWRDNFNLIFNIKPALTNEELLEINNI